MTFSGVRLVSMQIVSVTVQGEVTPSCSVTDRSWSMALNDVDLPDGVAAEPRRSPTPTFHHEDQSRSRGGACGFTRSRRRR